MAVIAFLSHRVICARRLRPFLCSIIRPDASTDFSDRKRNTLDNILWPCEDGAIFRTAHPRQSRNREYPQKAPEKYGLTKVKNSGKSTQSLICPLALSACVVYTVAQLDMVAPVCRVEAIVQRQNIIFEFVYIRGPIRRLW